MAGNELKAVVEMIRGIVANPNATIQEQRASFENSMGMMPTPPNTKVTPVKVDGIPAEWVESPSARADHAILYLHGGGYVIGSPVTHRSLAGKLSETSKARVLVIDYRMAPENPFPAAVDDAVKAYRWLLAQGVSPAKLAISGDSAGGGLTLATLVALRDAKVALPKAVAMLSPWTDLTGDSQTMVSRAEKDPMVQKPGLMAMGALYLNGKDAKTPLASPLFADLRALPPMLIQVGDHETLLDDSRTLEKNAKAAGVDVTLEVWDEMIHVWHLFHPVLPEGVKALERIGGYLNEKWAA
ncbi:MAG: alpha/beta hydrolase [Alphaproteobacteria bacterium]|nr:alpha/beta hydrolase [Alphaproteobacteria bacterium]